jgi:hypothetical protein
LPDQRFMEFTGWTARSYWQWIHDRATTAQVRAHALRQIAEMSSDEEA